jgi:hypothetical protein
VHHGTALQLELAEVEDLVVHREIAHRFLLAGIASGRNYFIR